MTRLRLYDKIISENISDFFAINANPIAIFDTIYMKAGNFNEKGELFMDYSRNEKYFRSKNTHFYAGLVMLVIGVALVILQRAFWLYYFFMIGAALAVIGAILAFVPQWSRSSDKDIDELISKEKDGYLKKKISELELVNTLSPNADSVLIAGYDYDDSDALIKRGLDGKIRSSVYCISAVIITKKGIVTSKRKFSLVNNSDTEEIKEILFSEADRAEMITHTVPFREGKNDTEIKTADFVIYSGETVAFRTPTAPNATVESTASDIVALIKRSKA